VFCHVRDQLSSTLFPYTTLFRSLALTAGHRRVERAAVVAHGPGRREIVGGDEDGGNAVCPPGLPAFVETVVHAGFDPQLAAVPRSEEHTSELQSRENLVCRLLLE